MLFTLCTLLNAIICCLQLNTQGLLRWHSEGGLLVIDVVGWRSMYFVVMPGSNLIVVFMSCIGIVMQSLFVNCPAVIRSPNMLFIFHGEDTTSELWTPVHSFTLITIYCKLCSLYWLQTNTIFHNIRITLCFRKTGEIDNLTVPLGQSALVMCVCRFHVALTPVVAPANISCFNLRSDFSLLLVR